LENLQFVHRFYRSYKEGKQLLIFAECNKHHNLVFIVPIRSNEEELSVIWGKFTIRKEKLTKGKHAILAIVWIDIETPLCYESGYFSLNI